LLIAGIVLGNVAAAADKIVVSQFTPSEADPAVKQFNDPNIAIADPALPPDAPLAIFLPGTGGKPGNAPALLATIAGQGYRVIGVAYNDEPAVVQLCPQNPDPDCSARFREMRVTGTGPGVPGVTNSVPEAIIPRLVAALRTLDRKQPRIGWGQYLDGDQPRWDRIVVSGLSQGAGMAAYIAKQHAVRRVVLFSSPWEFTGPDRHPAPWIGARSATPLSRWYAEYNARERTVPLIKAAYAMLQLRPDHILVFDLDLPPGVQANGPNPFHGITIRDTRYTPQWQQMFGRGSDAPTP
jgi:hypothetical protein